MNFKIKKLLGRKVININGKLIQDAPLWLHRLIYKAWKIYQDIRMPERKKSFGSLNPDKTFYVVRLFPPGSGTLTNYNLVLDHMEYAYNNGWIPVIDMENYYTYSQMDYEVNGTRNVWEYFFEQPIDKTSGKRFTLSEVYNSNNVVLAKANAYFHPITTIDRKAERSMMVSCVPFNKYVNEYFDSVLKNLLGYNNNTLAVIIRGRDFKHNHPRGHHIPALAEDIFNEVMNLSWEYDSVFVESDDIEEIAKIKEYFPNAVFNEGLRIKYDGKDATKDGAYENQLRYFSSIYVASKCKYLIGSMCSGFSVAIEWNQGEYADYKLIDKGVYG